MTSGGAYLKLAGGNAEIGGLGGIVEKFTHHHWAGPASLATDLPRFETGPVDQKFILRHDPGGEQAQAVPHTPYEITLTDGSTVSGVSDALGKTDLLARDRLRIADIRILGDKE